MEPIKLDEKSKEYTSVVNHFLDSVYEKSNVFKKEDIEMVHIKRIQNFDLYERYYFAKQRIIKKLNKLEEDGKDITPFLYEVFGFHGTNKTPPEIIYTSKEGIDRRYTSTGVYGYGAYFAVTSGYSCYSRYLHQNDKGEYKLLLWRVCPGIMADKDYLDESTESILGINPNTGAR